MSYTPPNADNIQFDFTEDGYTPPSADNISFVFEPEDVDRTVTAPIAVARSRNKEGVSLGITIPGVIALAKARYSGVGKSLVLVYNTSIARARIKTSVNLALSPVVAPTALARSFYAGYAGPPALPGIGVGALAKSRAYAWFEPFTNNTSWDDRRPCAVTFDGMTGFDMGPDDWWDTESSLYARPWMIKAYGGNTWIARAKEDWTGWDLDWYREWFQLPEEAGEGCEFDLTFDQNSRPFVCWETDGKIWIHYYDPVEEEMRTRELCSGRTPRAKLDVRRGRLSGESDIILFYINDDEDRVEYRLQRDRYDDAYATDLEDVSNVYLELLYMSSNYRLYLFFSEYDSNAKTYSMGYWHSAPYPYVMEDEHVKLVGDSVRAASIRSIFIAVGIDDEEIQLDGDSIIEASIRMSIHEYTMDDSEISLDEDTIESATLRQAIFEASIEDEEVALDGDEIRSATLTHVMIEDTIEDEEIALDGDSIQSATKS